MNKTDLIRAIVTQRAIQRLAQAQLSDMQNTIDNHESRLPIIFRGHTGRPGNDGPIGNTGLQGEVGSKGDVGLQGPIGLPPTIHTVDTKLSINGDPFIELKGKSGRDGIDGKNGRNGKTGKAGITEVIHDVIPDEWVAQLNEVNNSLDVGLDYIEDQISSLEESFFDKINSNIVDDPEIVWAFADNAQGHNWSFIRNDNHTHFSVAIAGTNQFFTTWLPFGEVKVIRRGGGFSIFNLTSTTPVVEDLVPIFDISANGPRKVTIQQIIDLVLTNQLITTPITSATNAIINRWYLSDTTAGELDLLAPLATGNKDARFKCSKTGGNNGIVVTAQGSELINGEPTMTIQNLNTSITLQSDGTDWRVA